MTLVTLLPLSFVMIAGPQIISAVFLATSVGWARNSALYLLGAALSVSAFTIAAWVFVVLIKGGSTERSTGGEGNALDAVLLGLLLIAALLVFRNRHKSEPPKWMGKLQTASARFAFTLGVLLLGVFPTDIVTSVTVGTKVAREGEPWWHVFGFVGLTVLLLAVPALLVVLLGARAKTALPKVREWMSSHSWIISELVIALFVGIELKGLLD